MSKINSDAGLMRNLLENFDRESNYASMKGPGDFQPEENSVPELLKSRRAQGILDVLVSDIAKIIRKTETDPQAAYNDFKKYSAYVSTEVETAFDALSESPNAGLVRKYDNAFSEIMFDENGQIVQPTSSNELTQKLKEILAFLRDLDEEIQGTFDYYT